MSCGVCVVEQEGKHYVVDVHVARGLPGSPRVEVLDRSNKSEDADEEAMERSIEEALKAGRDVVY